MDRLLTTSSQEPLLDVRPAPEFEQLHRTTAVNMPLEELADRAYELPPRSTPVAIYDSRKARADAAAALLRDRDRLIGQVYFGPDWLAAGPTAQGPSPSRLWQPHALLQEAIAWIRVNWPAQSPRRALDVACGSGRDAVFLALSGFDTEAWDILPDALAQCAALAARSGVSVRTRQCDVTTGAISPWQKGTGSEPSTLGAIKKSLSRGACPLLPRAAMPAKQGYDLVCCFNFLHRPAMPALAAAVRPGGLMVYETFVQPQRELFGRPRRDAHILRPGELPKSFLGWDVLVSREGIASPRRCVASFIARRRT